MSFLQSTFNSMGEDFTNYGRCNCRCRCQEPKPKPIHDPGGGPIDPVTGLRAWYNPPATEESN